jgi:hypothetical protein
METGKTRNPPRWIEDLTAALLPPAHRQQVLGDLEERFREAPRGRATLLYVCDVLSIIPRLPWNQPWTLTARPVPLPASITRESLRRTVDDYQRSVHCRNLYNFGVAFFLAVCFLVRIMTPDRPLHKLACLAGIAAVTIWVRHYHRRGGAQPTPAPDAPLPALIEFHRAQLIRQRDFFRRLWQSRIVAWAPFIVLLAADSISARGRVGATAMIFAFAMVMSAAAARRTLAPQFQSQIDRLGSA